MRSLRRMVLVGGLLTALLGGAAVPAQAAFPGRNGRVVSAQPQQDYSCEPEDGGHCPDPRPGPPQIVTNTLAGTDPKTLASGTHPTYSATGTRIAYVWRGAIWTMDAGGSRKTQLTRARAGRVDSRPAWAPKGRRLVFQRTTADGASLYVIRSDGGRPRRLTAGRKPEWSSRNTIAFVRRSQGKRRVHTIRPDGTGLTPVRGTRRATDVSWSPDASRLAFIRPSDRPHRECLVTVDARTGARDVLTCGLHGIDLGRVDGLAWAPNGRSILVAVVDNTDEPENVDGRTLRLFLSGGTRRVLGAWLQPDWAPRVGS